MMTFMREMSKSLFYFLRCRIAFNVEIEALIHFTDEIIAYLLLRLLWQCAEAMFQLHFP